MNLFYILFITLSNYVLYREAYTYNREKHDNAEFVKYDPIDLDGNIVETIFTAIFYTLLIFPVMWVFKAICMLLPYWVTKILLYLFSIGLTILLVWVIIKLFD